MGMGKSNNKKKEGTMSYVIMFGYGRGVAHSNAHTWVGLTVCFWDNQNKQNARIKNWLFGYGGLSSH